MRCRPFYARPKPFRTGLYSVVRQPQDPMMANSGYWCLTLVHADVHAIHWQSVAQWVFAKLKRY